MEFCISIGGVSMALCHRYDYIRTICREYLTDTPPAFSVAVTDKQIEEEMAITNGQYSPALCEGICLHREIVKALVPYGIILIHAAVIAVDGEAYVFLAKSGVGKSTHIRLWREQFGERAVVVNGDKPMFSFRENTLYAHGTPWRGKEGWGKNISLPVKAFCLLERGEGNAIAPASNADVVRKIFHQVLLPADAPNLARFMNMLDKILREIPFYKLSCNMEQEAALVAFRGMKGAQI